MVVSHQLDHLSRRNPATWQDNAAVAIEPHKLEVDGSNPSPATNERPQQQITIADKWLGVITQSGLDKLIETGGIRSFFIF